MGSALSYASIKDPFNWLSLNALFDNPPPEVPFIWGSKNDGLMQERSFVMMHASEKMGKSMFTLNLAVAGARGDKEFLGIPIRDGGFRTLILQCEVHMRAIYERFLEMVQGTGGLTREQAENIAINSCRTATLTNSLGRGWLRYKIRKFRRPGIPLVVVIDPLARLLTEDENSNVAVGRELAPMLKLRDDPGCSVLVVHHDSKVGDGNAGRPAHQRSRGANRLTADPDSIWSLSRQNRKGGPTAKFECTARYGKQLEPFRVRLNENTFWFERYTKEDEYGDDVVKVLDQDLDEPSLIAALREKWNLHDVAHNDRTLRQRLEKVVESNRVRRYEVAGIIIYTVVKRDTTE